MTALLGAVIAVGLWYAFAWGVQHNPVLMADVVIYGFAPATLGVLGWSAVRLWQQTRRP